MLLLFGVTTETLKYWTTKDHLNFTGFEDTHNFHRSREGTLTDFLAKIP